jgi:hypothetical protein
VLDRCADCVHHAIAELASITKAARHVDERAPGHATCTKYPAASPAQSCRRRPLQLGKSTSEAVAARFLAVCCPALLQLLPSLLAHPLTTHIKPTPWLHPCLRFDILRRRTPPPPATALLCYTSVSSRTELPPVWACACCEPPFRNPREGSTSSIYTPPELNHYITLHYIASSLHERIRRQYTHILDYAYRSTRAHGSLSSTCLVHKALLPSPRSSVEAYGVDKARAPT